MSDTETERLQQALADVMDPAFERPMVELGLIDVLQASGDKASLRVRLSANADELKERIRQDVEKVLASEGIREVDIEWDVRVPTRQTMPDDPIPDVRNVILVMSGKGGVGKSTCAVNMALALARRGTRVGLLDADVWGPSVPTMMGISGHPRSPDGKTIEPLQRFGVKLMSIGFLVEDPRSAIIWRGPMLTGALQQFLKDVSWGELDYLVLDLPPGTGDIALTLAQRLRTTGAVIVTTPQEVALQDVYKAVSMCEKLQIPMLGVIENMSYFVDPAGLKHELFGSGGGEKVAEFAKAPLLGQVPIDPQVRQWGDDGTPVVQAAPQSAPARAFNEVADALATRIAVEHFERGGRSKAPATEGQRRLKILR